MVVFTSLEFVLFYRKDRDSIKAIRLFLAQEVVVRFHFAVQTKVALSNNRQIKKGLDSWPDISIQCKEYTREEIKKMYEGTNNEIIELNKMADLYGLDWENTPNGIIIGHLFTGKNSKEIIEKIFKHYGWSKRDD